MYILHKYTYVGPGDLDLRGLSIVVSAMSRAEMIHSQTRYMYSTVEVYALRLVALDMVPFGERDLCTYALLYLLYICYTLYLS